MDRVICLSILSAGRQVRLVLRASEGLTALLDSLVADGVHVTSAGNAFQRVVVLVKVLGLENPVFLPAGVRRHVSTPLLEGAEMLARAVLQLFPALAGLQLGQKGVGLKRQPRQIVVGRVLAHEAISRKPPPQVVLDNARADDGIAQKQLGSGPLARVQRRATANADQENELQTLEAAAVAATTLPMSGMCTTTTL